MNQTSARSLPALLVALALAALPGCRSESGPPRYDLSGAVLYDGKPVPVGEVALEPDGSRGNTGPGCLAVIKDGKYRTAPDKGVLGGAYLVRIVGFDGVPAGDSSVGTALFPPFETKVEFPRQSTTHDFTVPPAKGR